jgi:hypothetical protein
MFRLVQGHHQGELYKDIQVQQILSKFDPPVSTCTRPSSGRIIQRHTSTANSIEVRPTCFDLYKAIIRENYTKTYKYSKFYRSSSHMFRLVEGHHQGELYKGIHVQPILSKIRVCTVKTRYCGLKSLTIFYSINQMQIFFYIQNNILSSIVAKHLRQFLSSSFEGSATLSSGQCHATLHHSVLDSWTKHLCTIVTKPPTDMSRKQQDLTMHPRFTPACFSKSLPSSEGRSYLRRYSSNLYCGCIWIMACPEGSVVEGCNQVAPRH